LTVISRLGRHQIPVSLGRGLLHHRLDGDAEIAEPRLLAVVGETMKGVVTDSSTKYQARLGLDRRGQGVRCTDCEMQRGKTWVINTADIWARVTAPPPYALPTSKSGDTMMPPERSESRARRTSGASFEFSVNQSARILIERAPAGEA
jgi:hypothetical protein